MAINLKLYSNANNASKTIVVDFEGEVSALSDDVTADDTIRYYFKFTTGAKDMLNASYVPRLVTDLSDLALNKTVQSATNTSAAYSNVNAMVVDYVYDYIHGHAANKYSSGVSYRPPMKFS